MRRLPAAFAWFGVAAAILGLWLTTSAQTLPPGLNGLCGFASAATPLSATVASGAVYASLSVTNTPVSPTIPVVTQGTIIGAVVFVEIAPIRVRMDGGAPTSLAGMQYGPSPAPGGAAFVVCGSDLGKLQYVAASAVQGNSTVHQWFYGSGR